MIGYWVNVDTPDWTEWVVWSFWDFATPLIAAIHSWNIDLVKFLLESGADVNLRINNQSALGTAYTIYNDAVINLLIEYWVDENTATRLEKTYYEIETSRRKIRNQKNNH